MLMNAVNYMEKTIDEKNDGFSDINDVSDYAIEAVKKLSGIGIINGYDDGTFKPQNTANRAEAAKIIYAVIKTFNLQSDFEVFCAPYRGDTAQFFKGM